MAITRTTHVRTKRGFALLMAVIFMSVMLSFGLSLTSLAYKQQVLASGAVASQYAFYIADMALECLLYADQQDNIYAYPSVEPVSAPAMTCDGTAPYETPIFTWSPDPDGEFVVKTRLSLSDGKYCADVAIYKPSDVETFTYLFSQGYNAPCSVVASPDATRFVSRGLGAQY